MATRCKLFMKDYSDVLPKKLINEAEKKNNNKVEPKASFTIKISTISKSFYEPHRWIRPWSYIWKKT